VSHLHQLTQDYPSATVGDLGPGERDGSLVLGAQRRTRHRTGAGGARTGRRAGSTDRGPVPFARTLCDVDTWRPIGTATGELTVGDLAELVFCSDIQPSHGPDPDAVRAVVIESLRDEEGRLKECGAHLAGCYGDDPEWTCRRMRWARSAVIATFCGRDSFA
jgi:hypothetical protein